MQKWKNLKHIFLISIFSVIFILGIFHLFSREFFLPLNYFFVYKTGNNIWQDVIYKPKLEASNRIIVVSIDDETTNALQGKSEQQMLSIPKKYYQDLTEILLKNGVRAIGFDIIFQNRDETEDGFANILEKNPNAVIGTTNTAETSAYAHQSGDNLSAIKENSCHPDKNQPEKITCEGIPRSIYQNATWGMISVHANEGFNTTESRKNGYDIRNYVTQKRLKFGEKNPNDHEAKIFSLPIAMLEKSGAKNLEKYQNPIGKTLMQPYFQRKNNHETPYETIPMIRILENPNDFREKLENSYVFVGALGSTINDFFIAPDTGKRLAGVYSHALFLDGILQNKIPEKVPISVTYGILAIISGIFVAVFFYTPKFIAPIFAIFGTVSVIFLGRYLYGSEKLIIDITPLLASAGIVTYPVTYIYKFFILERDKRMILHTFSRYLSPEVVKKIDAKEISATIGGEKKELSILFSDIAGFTTISEKLDVKTLFGLMTMYLSTMTNILVDQKWTLDKYIWDAVMGFFGAPVSDTEHAKNACLTAIKMRWALGEINEKILKMGLDPIDFRVGIATGEVMVGNIGSENRFNYTVLGDAVNLASRLEATGKEYQVSVIIAESTKNMIGDDFIVRELDYIAVKGKNTGTRIFELIGTKDQNIDTKKYRAYEQALTWYREGKYLDAGRLWERLSPMDPPAKIMALRCVSLLKGEMSLQNGVYIMTRK